MIDDEYSIDSDEDAGSSPETMDNVDEEVEENLGIVADQKRKLENEVLTPDEIVRHMLEIVREVTCIIQIPDTIARILLNHFKWDKEKLMESFYDCKDQEKLFHDARIINPFRRSVSTATASARHATNATPPGRSCDICCTECRGDEMTGLECGHQFCSSCWTHYLTTKIMDEGMGQTISCAAHNCDILVDDDAVVRLVEDKQVRTRYQHLITNSFVECNRQLRWCPSADCANAVKIQYADHSKPVACKCGWKFCFSCGHEWHDLVKCVILKQWVKKCNDDSETSNWIAANTKECPTCHVTIEKNGGCNHMTCRSQACKNEFCWVCLGPWVVHSSSWGSCNRYDDEASRAARDAQERSRAALQRYLHYCNRYTNHRKSLKFENRLYASVKVKMEEMQLQSLSWIEVQFLPKAVDVLCLCRRTLMYTYVFAYYLTKNNQSLIFEDNQQDLEMATEQLSEFLERDLERENLTTLKQKVQDKYRYCDQRRKALLDHCREGDEKNWWIFDDI